MSPAASRRAAEAAPLPVGLRLVAALSAVAGGALLLTLAAVLHHQIAGHLLLSLPGAGLAALASTVAPFAAGAWIGAALARITAAGSPAPRPVALALAATAGAAGASLALSLAAAGTTPAGLSGALEAGAAAATAVALAFVAGGFAAPPLAGPRRLLPLLLPALAAAGCLAAAAAAPVRFPTAAAAAERHAWGLARLGEPYRLAGERLAGDAALRAALGEPLAVAPAAGGPQRVLLGAGGWSADLALEVSGPRGATACALSGVRPLVGDRSVRWQEPDCAPDPGRPGSQGIPAATRSPAPQAAGS